MKKFIAKIDVMPHKELLDPQGKTVTKNISQLQIQGVKDIRIGKHIEMYVEAETLEEAKNTVDISCKKLLTNAITEFYTFQMQEAN